MTTDLNLTEVKREVIWQFEKALARFYSARQSIPTEINQTSAAVRSSLSPISLDSILNNMRVFLNPNSEIFDKFEEIGKDDTLLKRIKLIISGSEFLQVKEHE